MLNMSAGFVDWDDLSVRADTAVAAARGTNAEQVWARPVEHSWEDRWVALWEPKLDTLLQFVGKGATGKYSPELPWYEFLSAQVERLELCVRQNPLPETKEEEVS